MIAPASYGMDSICWTISVPVIGTAPRPGHVAAGQSIASSTMATPGDSRPSSSVSRPHAAGVEVRSLATSLDVDEGEPVGLDVVAEAQ